MSFLFRSKYKRPAALTDADYDHEIQLVDHSDRSVSLNPSRSLSRSQQAQLDALPTIVVTDSSSRDQFDESLGRKRSLRAELTRRKWKKYRDVHVAADEIEENSSFTITSVTCVTFWSYCCVVKMY